MFAIFALLGIIIMYSISFAWCEHLSPNFRIPTYYHSGINIAHWLLLAVATSAFLFEIAMFVLVLKIFMKSKNQQNTISVQPDGGQYKNLP